ncbi:DNA-processing protein DprA [Thermodesulfobacteriota bacterium]
MENLFPWFRLKSTPGVGNLLYKRLIDVFHSPENAIHAPRKDLLQVEGLSDRLIAAIKRHTLPESVKKELDKVQQKGIKILTLTDTDYPALLLEIPDPPPYLYVYGCISATKKSISIVGSRNATQYGRDTTQRLGRDLASLGMAIVSGMARGIDTAAHEGALMACGKTIAVLGSGLERVYPKENETLFHRIAETGAVISEFPLRAEPEAHHFPMRNRIISGLSLGTVIVEATLRSGSLITARLAAEQNREVFAVPGSINSFKSTGTHTLIKQGAKLVEQAGDIMEEIAHRFDPSGTEGSRVGDVNTAPKPPLSPLETTVLRALEHYPLHIDDLIRKLGMEPSDLSGTLLRLELKGIVQQDPGKLFYIKNKIGESIL